MTNLTWQAFPDLGKLWKYGSHADSGHFAYLGLWLSTFLQMSVPFEPFLYPSPLWGFKVWNNTDEIRLSIPFKKCLLLPEIAAFSERNYQRSHGHLILFLQATMWHIHQAWLSLCQTVPCTLSPGCCLGSLSRCTGGSWMVTQLLCFYQGIYSLHAWHSWKGADTQLPNWTKNSAEPKLALGSISEMAGNRNSIFRIFWNLFPFNAEHKI